MPSADLPHVPLHIENHRTVGVPQAQVRGTHAYIRSHHVVCMLTALFHAHHMDLVLILSYLVINEDHRLTNEE
jgi:hypothetical protein